MRGLVVAALLLAVSNAWAQAPEPEPPGGGPMKIDATPPSDVGIGKYQLGARVRGIFVTHDMLSPYLAANTGTSMESWAVGLEFIYRRPKYDVVTSLDFSWLDVKDGNYLGAGHDPSLDTHYVQFRDLSFVSIDVSIIGHHKFLPWLELRYGGGVGLGYVPGDVLLTNNSDQVCNAQTAAHPDQCYPIAPGIGAIKPDDPNFEQKLQQTQNGVKDTAQNPHRHVSGDKPPVMGVVNLLVGLRFYPIPRLALTYEIGFRNAIFTGIGVHYLF